MELDQLNCCPDLFIPTITSHQNPKITDKSIQAVSKTAHDNKGTLVQPSFLINNEPTFSFAAGVTLKVLHATPSKATDDMRNDERMETK